MRSIGISTILFVAAAFVALGCAGDADRSELEDNRALWQSYGITDYTMQVDGVDGAPTVDTLFDDIERSIDQGVAVEVEYNDDYGFPERLVSVDPDEGDVDFEVAFLEFDIIDAPGGDIRTPPPPAPPVAPPQAPGFDQVLDDPAPDAPGAAVFVTDDGALRYVPQFGVVAPGE